jgi:hypothetical protein
LGPSNLHPPDDPKNVDAAIAQSRSVQALQQARADCIASETLLAEEITRNRKTREEPYGTKAYWEWFNATVLNLEKVRSLLLLLFMYAAVATGFLAASRLTAPKTPLSMLLSIIENLPTPPCAFFIDRRNVTQAVLRHVWAEKELEQLVRHFKQDGKKGSNLLENGREAEPRGGGSAPILIADLRFHYLLYSAIGKRRKVRSCLLSLFRRTSRYIDGLRDKESKEKQAALQLIPLALGAAALLGLGQAFIVHNINDVKEKQLESHTELRDKLHEMVLQTQSTSLNHSDSSTIVTDRLVDRQRDQETIIEQQIPSSEKSDIPPSSKIAIVPLASASTVVNVAGEPVPSSSPDPSCTEQQTEFLLFFSPEKPEAKATIGNLSYKFKVLEPQRLGARNKLRWPTLQGSVEFTSELVQQQPKVAATKAPPEERSQELQHLLDEPTPAPSFTLYYDARKQPMFNAELQADVWVTRGSRSYFRPFGHDIIGKDLIVLHIRPRDKISQEGSCRQDPKKTKTEESQKKLVSSPSI